MRATQILTKDSVAICFRPDKYSKHGGRIERHLPVPDGYTVAQAEQWCLSRIRNDETVARVVPAADVPSFRISQQPDGPR